MTDPKPIRVMIVDDHSMMRTGLRYTLKSFDDLELVAEAGSGAQALELCAQVDPQVILMDMVMPGLDGAETTHLIRQRHPQIQIIAVTSFQDQDLIERALQAGAIGYLLKNVAADELARAIRAAHAGQSTLAQEAADALVQSTQQKADLGHDLTAREKEVLVFMAEGLTNAQIADRLTVSLSTVKFHVRGILSKLHASNRAEAVTLAWRHRLITGSEPPSPTAGGAS
jgi:NarL family two-component system response regulator LiaR